MIAGAGTIALELLDDLPVIDTVIVPIGGGGLISGIAIAMKALSPSTRVVGVEVAASCPFTKSLAAGHLVTIDVAPSLADGLTGNLDPDTVTLAIVRDLVDGIVTVDEPILHSALAGLAARAPGDRRGGGGGTGGDSRRSDRAEGERRGDSLGREHRSRG